MIWRDHVFNFGPKIGDEGDKISGQFFLSKFCHPRCRFLGQNWKHDLARSCFILETAFHVSTENGKEQLRSAPWTMWIAKSALSAKTTWHTWRWTKGLINQPRYSHIFSIWFMTITFLFEIINALFSTLLMLCLILFICDCCKIGSGEIVHNNCIRLHVGLFTWQDCSVCLTTQTFSYYGRCSGWQVWATPWKSTRDQFELSI